MNDMEHGAPERMTNDAMTNSEPGTGNVELGTVELLAQCETYLAGWKRAQADYANLKKESEREKSELTKFANERLLDSLLPAIDQFDMALSHAPDLSGADEEATKRIQNWIVGIRAVKTAWENAFKTIGLDRVSTEGAFDPLIHEAVGEEPGETDGAITREVQPGWRLNGKLLRPARVLISKQSH